MTKNDMIKTIRDAEVSAWLDLAKYDLENKPIVTSWEQEKDWAEHDIGHTKLVNQWYGIKTVMESMSIAAQWNEKTAEATDINHEIWKREQAAKGIYYDENGNRIVA